MDRTNCLSQINRWTLLEWTERVPFVSTISSLTHLFFKHVWKLESSSYHSVAQKYIDYINRKEDCRLMVLLVPGFGNLIIALHDFRMPSQKIQKDTSETLDIKVDSKTSSNAEQNLSPYHLTPVKMENDYLPKSPETPYVPEVNNRKYPLLSNTTNHPHHGPYEDKEHEPCGNTYNEEIHELFG